VVDGLRRCALIKGKRIRASTVVDNFTRRSLAIEVDNSPRGDQVLDVLGRLLKEHGATEVHSDRQWSRVIPAPKGKMRASDEKCQ